MITQIRRRLFLALIGFCLSFQSCIPIQKYYSGKTIPLNYKSLSSVYGIYQDISLPDSDNGSAPLWFQLSKSGKGYEQPGMHTPGTYQVSLEPAGKNKMIARLHSNGKQVGKRKILRGKMKDGRFEVFNMLLIPFFPIYCVYDARRISIGQTDQGISVDSRAADWGLALVFFGGAHSSNASGAYQKIR